LKTAGKFALPARNALRSNAGKETRKGDFKLLETEFVSGVSFCGTFWTYLPAGRQAKSANGSSVILRSKT